MNGIEEQIKMVEYKKDGVATLQDFADMCNLLMSNSAKLLVVIIGAAGYLKTVFDRIGRTKLPRKLKKRIFLTAKLRRKHIPEYYTK